MCRHNHPLAGTDRRRNRVFPIRHRASDGLLQGLAGRELFSRDAAVPRVPFGVTWVIGGERWWGDRVAPSPYQDLLVSVPCRRLGLVETLEIAVVPLVE